MGRRGMDVRQAEVGRAGHPTVHCSHSRGCAPPWLAPTAACRLFSLRTSWAVPLQVESDESATLASITDIRAGILTPLVDEHRGRIVKLMGDGALVEFASVVDAVNAAVAIQEQIAREQAEQPEDRRIVLRMGINLGDVVVQDDDLMGDGVNVAARLEQLCPPGGILVSGTAFDQLQGKIAVPVEFAGEQRVKNIARSVSLYSVAVDGRVRKPRRASPIRSFALAAVLLLLVAAGGDPRLAPRQLSARTIATATTAATAPRITFATPRRTATYGCRVLYLSVHHHPTEDAAARRRVLAGDPGARRPTPKSPAGSSAQSATSRSQRASAATSSGEDLLISVPLWCCRALAQRLVEILSFGSCHCLFALPVADDRVER